MFVFVCSFASCRCPVPLGFMIAVLAFFEGDGRLPNDEFHSWFCVVDADPGVAGYRWYYCDVDIRAVDWLEVVRCYLFFDDAVE